jgi:hypothetical protein
MSDKCSFHGNPKDLIDKMNAREREMVTPPKSAYELLMTKRGEWFTDGECTRCHKPVRTNGQRVFCSEGCIWDNKPVKREEEKDYMGFITDYF